MGLIKNYANQAAYEAAGQPTSTRIARIQDSKQIKVDGVNIITNLPECGDAVYHDGNKAVFFKGGDQLVTSEIDANVYTKVGDVIGIIEDCVLIRDKNTANQKFLDVCQYGITAISSTSLVINLRMSPDYNVNTAVNVTLTSASIDATSAAEISAAVAAKATEVGDTKAWWAYLADGDGNKVDSDGTQIIIQCDTCVDYRFYNVSATGCTIAHITWDDMPSNSTSGFRVDGTTGVIMNAARGAVYYGTSGTAASALAEMVKVGDSRIMSQSAYENSPYCAELRNAYGSYLNYITNAKMGMWPQKGFGSFSLPSGKELTMKYGLKTAPTKDGGEKYKFPFLYYCYNRSYGVDGLDFGDWFAPGAVEGILIMHDETLSKVNPTATKMGNPVISNSTFRWFAQRYNVGYAWFFNGNIGTLYGTNVYYAYLAQAVTLYKIKH